MKTAFKELNAMGADVKTVLEGFRAAAAGQPRDESQSAEWLEGYDGFAIGQAQEKARQEASAALYNSPQQRAIEKRVKAKLRRRYQYSSTPRTLY